MLGDVVGHDNPGLADAAEAFKLSRAHEEGAGFAGADAVVEQHSWLIIHPLNSVALIAVGGELGAQSREGAVGAVPVCGDVGVEGAVVSVDNLAASGVIGHDPRAERVPQGAAAALRKGGGLGVDAAAMWVLVSPGG